MKCDAVIVGGGLAGLTTAAFLCKAGLTTILLEKEGYLGGLVNSYVRNGFTFDGGIRAIENSGIVKPMLKQLGLDIEFLPSTVSVGFGRDVVRLTSDESLKEYCDLLCRKFPENTRDVMAIIEEISRVMEYMDVLYGIDNPLFQNLKEDPKYILKVLLPWVVKYAATMPKVSRLKGPVDEYLKNFTQNRSLIDMFGQHFFKMTPTFFALSYFSLYLDYKYPKGGTGAFPEKLSRYIREHGGQIFTGVEIVRIDPCNATVTDKNGIEYSWKRLVWAADCRTMYRNLDLASLRNNSGGSLDSMGSTGSPKVAARVLKAIEDRIIEVADKRGGDSIFTLNLAVNLPPSYFERIASAHFFYTPLTKGLSAVPLSEIIVDGSGGFTHDKALLFDWIGRYLELTTYEISCPALRDPSLAPAGKSGLIISSLMEYSLVKHFRELGYYEELRDFCAAKMTAILDAAIFPGLQAAVLDSFTSTPLTIEAITGNTDGAITGWAFTNPSMPAVNSLPRVASSVLTPIPGVYQAGQWSYSPSGLPISILTGKLAADRVVKDLGKRKG